MNLPTSKGFNRSWIKFIQFKVILIGVLLCKLAFALPSEIVGFDLVNGGQISVQFNQVSKATVLVFLGVTCPCSRHHLPALNQLFQEFGNSGFRFIGVHSNSNEDFELAREYFKTSKINFPVLQDTASQIAIQLDALKTPHVFVISPKLDILYRGNVDNTAIKTATRQYLKDALTAINNGKKPQIDEVRPLGCKIRRP